MPVLLKARAGDSQAFEELLVKYYPRVLNFIFRYVFNRTVAEDLTQDVFLKVYRHLPRFRIRKAQFQTWVFTIARNTALDEVRRSRKFAYSLDQDRESEKGVFATETQDLRAEDPAQKLLARERTARVRSAIANLPEQQKAAILLRQYEKMPYDQIAAALGVSIPAVKSLLNRARENLRIRLTAFVTNPEEDTS